LKKLQTHVRRRKLPFFVISSATGEGIDELKYSIASHVDANRKLHLHDDDSAAESTFNV
jgi:GTP-binding protein